MHHSPIVGEYESLGYELVENAVYVADQSNQTHLDKIHRSAAKWGMCFMLGEWDWRGRSYALTTKST